MNLRRLTLLLTICALAFCGIFGAMAVLHGTDQMVKAVLAVAIAATVASGIIFPLTFLVDRPKYRIGGIAGIVLVLLLLLDISELFFFDTAGRGTSFLVIECLVSAMGLLLLYGLPVVSGLLLLQFRWVRFSAWTITGVSSAALGLVALAIFLSIFKSPPAAPAFMPAPIDLISDHLMDASLATFFPGLVVALLLINAGCQDRRHFRYPAILLAIGAAVAFVCSFFPHTALLQRETTHVGFYLLLPAIFCAHLNLLLMAPSIGLAPWIRAGTLAASFFCLLIIGDGILVTVPGDATAAIAIFSGIFAGCGSLALIGLSLTRKRFDYREDKPAELLTHIDIKCPRCEKAQRLPLGDSACESCGLRFNLMAIEPHCAECGYLLYGITSPRCPECGAAVAGAKPLDPSAPTPAPQIAPSVPAAPAVS